MSLVSDIKKMHKSSPVVGSIEEMMVEQKFNKLFYNRPELHDERIGLHASAVIASDDAFCYREQVLSLLYKQVQNVQHPAGLMRIFAAGNSIHEKWQTLFERGGISRGIEVRSYDTRLELYFTPDAIIELNSKLYVVEIKSVNTYQFKTMKSHPSGKKQLMLYMFLLGIPRGMVLCEDKNTQEFKIFIYEYEPELVIHFVERLEKIQQYKRAFLKRKVMIDGVCDKATCKRAMGCGMKDACFNIGIGRIKLGVAEDAE